MFFGYWERHCDRGRPKPRELRRGPKSAPPGSRGRAARRNEAARGNAVAIDDNPACVCLHGGGLRRGHCMRSAKDHFRRKHRTSDDESSAEAVQVLLHSPERYAGIVKYKYANLSYINQIKLIYTEIHLPLRFCRLVHELILLSL